VSKMLEGNPSILGKFPQKGENSACYTYHCNDIPVQGIHYNAVQVPEDELPRGELVSLGEYGCVDFAHGEKREYNHLCNLHILMTLGHQGGVW
jgi:hypothetical protein